MEYEVRVKQVEPVEVVSIRSKMSMSNIGTAMGACYDELYRYLQEAGGECLGGCYAVYHGEMFDPEDMDVECCFSVARPLPDKGRIFSRVLEGATVASTLHVGPYATLEGAYRALGEWVEKNGRTYAGPARDVYLDDPYNTPPEKLRTEVQFPIK